MAELAVLFWNIHGNDLRERLARIVEGCGVHVVILAECAVAPADVLAALNRTAYSQFVYPTAGSKLHVFARAPVLDLIEQYDDPLGRLSMRRLFVEGLPEFLLVAAHFPSRVNWDSSDLLYYAREVAQKMRGLEGGLGHSRSILIGDFNMNPFDTGMASAGGFHGVTTRQLAAREAREVLGQDELMLYNPMWAHFGDRTPGSPGSYYLRSSRPGNYFWNVYDQVLVRPELAEALQVVRLLDHDGRDSLLTAGGLPDSVSASDHLPLLARFSF